MPKVTKLASSRACALQWLFKDPWTSQQSQTSECDPDGERRKEHDVQYTLTEKFIDIVEDAASASAIVSAKESPRHTARKHHAANGLDYAVQSYRTASDYTQNLAA